MRCTSRSRGDRRQLLLVGAARHARSPAWDRRASGCSRIHARARARKASTVSSSSALTPPPPATSTRSVRRWRCSLGVPYSDAVHGVPAEEEVEVVLEGDADAAVHLHAVLEELDAVVADVGLGGAHQLAGVGRAARRRPRPPRRRWRGWPRASESMSAKRCLSAWYDASGRPNEYRSKAHSTVMSKPACMAPTDSALREHDGRAAAGARPARRPRRPRRPRRVAGSRTSSKVTTEKRRVRSSVRSGVIDTPGASRGTSTWVSPSPVRPVTSRCSAWSAASTGSLHAAQHHVGAVDPHVERDVAEAAVGAGSASAPGGDRRRRLSRPSSTSDQAPSSTSLSAAATTLVGMQRPGRGAAPEGVGDQGEVDEARRR